MITARARRLGAVVVLSALMTVACGKKGAPLAPFVRIPAAVETISAARIGGDVYVSVTVPAANIDGSVPVDVARVEVYGYTGPTAPARARWSELGTLVATIPVSVPAEGLAGEPAPTQNPGPSTSRPGATATVLDRLDQSDLAPAPEAALTSSGPAVAGSAAASTGAPLRRFYTAIPFSERGRPGPPGAQAEFVIAPLPDPPTDLRATYDPTTVSLTWQPSGGLIGFLLDRSLPDESLPFDPPAPPATAVASQAPTPPAPRGPTTYNLYRASRPEPGAQPVSAPPAWSAAVPVAVNRAPLSAMSGTDAVEFGREVCYTVRAQFGGTIGEPSRPTCLTAVDVFPPTPPVGLAAVPSEGAISLIWEPNVERDLGGYLILRRGPGDATLRQLTGSPVLEARFRDAAVEPGAQYTYAVVAVDRQAPLPNVSAPSVSIDETAR